jgi:hypothetical protein
MASVLALTRPLTRNEAPRQALEPAGSPFSLGPFFSTSRLRTCTGKAKTDSYSVYGRFIMSEGRAYLFCRTINREFDAAGRIAAVMVPSSKPLHPLPLSHSHPECISFYRYHNLYLAHSHTRSRPSSGSHSNSFVGKIVSVFYCQQYVVPSCSPFLAVDNPRQSLLGPPSPFISPISISPSPPIAPSSHLLLF